MAFAILLGIYFALLQAQFLLVTCKNLYDDVQAKILMRLQKTSAGGDEKLATKFMWP